MIIKIETGPRQIFDKLLPVTALTVSSLIVM